MTSAELQALVRDRKASAFFDASATITRTANAAPYVAGDVIGQGGSKGALTLTSISNASPAVCTLVAHGLVNGDPVQLSTTGALPAGLTAFVTYYVVNKAADTFQLSATVGGAAINTSDAGSGVHTATHVGSAVLELSGIGLRGDMVRILQSQLQINITAVPSGMTSFRLYLYRTAPPSGLLDNAPWDLPSGDRGSFVGYVDLGTPVDLGSTLYVQTLSVNKEVILRDTELYGYLVTTAGWTPAASTSAKVTLIASAV